MHTCHTTKLIACSTIAVLVLWLSGCQSEVWHTDICMNAHQGNILPPETKQPANWIHDFKEIMDKAIELQKQNATCLSSPKKLRHEQNHIDKTSGPSDVLSEQVSVIDTPSFKYAPKKKNHPKSSVNHAPTSCIDINQADTHTLSGLPGIGQARAKAIITARERKPFKRKSDLRRIKGIGKKRYQQLVNYVCEITGG